MEMEILTYLFYRSHTEGTDLQMNTMKGLERLGDSLATLKGNGVRFLGQKMRKADVIFYLTKR
jgi:hypothetical protein